MLVDVNLLIYAHDTDAPNHRAARDWWDEQLNGVQRIGLPWPTLLAFQRIMTNPRLFRSPMSPAESWGHIARWLSLPNVWIPMATGEHATVLGSLIDATQATGNLISDAHLAAVAIEHGQTLYSTDTDFAKFPGLRWINPLGTHR